MTKVLGRAAVLAAAVAFVGCSAGMETDNQGPTSTVGATGGVSFDLSIPTGETVDQINVHLSCDDGINQDHVFDVSGGEVVGAIGGLTPGAVCTVDMTAQSSGGTDCLGSATFTVVQDVTTPVVVTLFCQGSNDGGAGSARVSAEFDLKACNVDRIRKIWAIPANLLEGEGTTVEVEAWPGSLVTLANPAVWSFAVVSGGSLSTGGSCVGDACSDFICGAVPVGSPVDPGTGLPTNVVTVEVTVEDDDCYDTETVFVECAQDAVCGDGTASGLEECDGTDGVTLPDECGPALAADQCQIRTCGDGVVNTAAEECDGTDGVIDPLTTVCDVDCTLIPLPYCGDDIINDGAEPGVEECDGLDLPYVGAVCNPDCTIEPDCGNGTPEAGEACDEGVANGAYPAACSTSCTVNAAPNFCKDCITAETDLSSFTVPCLADSLCLAVLDCVTLDTTDCWVSPDGAAACYCGAGNTLDCESAGFNPATIVPGHPSLGVCWSQIQAASGTTVNADVLARFYDFTGFPTLGNAGMALDFGFTNYCVAECTL